MAAAPELVPIRTCISKMAAFDISCNCSVEPGESTCKDFKNFPMNDSNNDMDNNEDGISDEDLEQTKYLSPIDESKHNVVKDLIMLAFYFSEGMPNEDPNEMAVKTSQQKPLKMKELHNNEDHITMDITTRKVGPHKARIPYFLQDQNWKMTTYDSDLLPG